MIFTCSATCKSISLNKEDLYLKINTYRTCVLSGY